MPFFSSASSVTNQVQAFSDIMDTRLKLGMIENLSKVCVDLADRFIESSDHKVERVERLSISGLGKRADAPDSECIEFKDIRDNQSLTHEQRGEAVLRRIAEKIEPTLMMNGIDNVAAKAAALEIAAQLGDLEFATLDQTAIQVAMGNRMTGLSASGVHITLGYHGEVLVHQTSQWTGYDEKEDNAVVRSGAAGAPILKTGVVTTFWLERADSSIRRAANGIRKLFGNASETKHYELHGKVQRCLLDTTDANLTATLKHNASSFIDTILNGLARIFGRAGIRIGPPNRLEDKLWESTSPRPRNSSMPESGDMQRPPSKFPDISDHRVQAFRSGAKEHNGIAGITVTTDSSGSGVAKQVKSGRAGGSPSLVSSQIEVRDFVRSLEGMLTEDAKLHFRDLCLMLPANFGSLS